MRQLSACAVKILALQNAPLSVAKPRLFPSSPLIYHHPPPTSNPPHPPPSPHRQDIVIASGASGALDLAIGTLLDPGDELLVPCPGFPLYTTIAEARGIKLSPYKLRPDADWEADLEQVDLLLQQARARGVRSTLLINNPSNPCGTVFSREHVTALLAIAERHAVPVISDEIYARVVFKGVEFVSAADVAPNVPVLVVGGIAKEYMVPGWRVGWLALYGEAGVSRQNGSLAAIRKGLAAVSQLTLGANSLILSALPAILTPRAGPQADGLAAWRAATLRQLEDNAKFACEALENIPGVAVVRPSGSMYLLFSVPSSPDGTRGDDVLFAKTLLNDMAVFVLPGAAFGAPGFCRIVLTPPIEKLREAFARIATFCAR